MTEPVNEIILGSMEREDVPHPIAEPNKSAKIKNATHHGKAKFSDKNV